MNALQLVVLYAEAEDDMFDKAAVRWLGRMLLERPKTLAVRTRDSWLLSGKKLQRPLMRWPPK